ncbi:D-aminoacyl-tRNA deacylase [Novipirellula artificiosorum]|uniref:D-aminoacyl-tRNA deacylase n=1 Tax=Novipirellula artificiosorum TaxID=2528016 RepID=A0A5C6E0B7_9BACT|nr:D-aminoacyl-tRNA deacylase [Novipirellula artificiosorum]TWU42165.1 D-tyrosyl-tRNA(Tyr) deacylase [Novipirellula artificiosorum]
MRIVIQRVSQARVEVQGRVVGKIDQGVMVLVGVGHGDGEPEAKWLAEKTSQLRIFPDEQGKMNRALTDTGGSVLAISQFTLLGDCRRGRRPGFTDAAEPKVANEVYQFYMACLRDRGIRVEQGIFAADMQVSLTNDGPVTLVIDRLPQQQEV